MSSDDPQLLRRLLREIDLSESIEDITRRIDAVLRACELLLRRQRAQELQMSALTDTLNSAIDRIAAKLAEATSSSEAMAALQVQKAELEANMASLQAQFDEQNAALQAAVDRLAGM